MTFYVKVYFGPGGKVDPYGTIEIVEGRAGASEIGMADATLLQKKAKKIRPDLDWQIDKTYSGKFVVRGWDET